MDKTPVSRQKANELITKAEEELNALKVQGINLESTNELLHRTKKAFEAKKLNQTISNLNELGAKLVEIKKYSTEFSELVLICHKNIKQANRIGLDINEFKEILRDANDMFDSEDFLGAIDFVKECNQKIIDTQFLHITELLKDIYYELKDLPKNIINSQGIQQRFTDADSAIKDNDFGLAWTLILQLKEISKDVLKPYLDKYQNTAKDKIIEFQNEIESAKDREIDISDANEIFTELIERMRKAQTVSEFKEIIDYTTAGHHALERALRRKSRIESSTKEAQVKLETLLSDIQSMNEYCAIPSSVETLIQNVKEKISRNDLDSAFEDIEQCSKKLTKLRNASSPKIELEIQTDQLRSDLWNRTKLKVFNKGLATARNITIEFSGPLEVRRIPVVDTLAYNSSEIIEFGLKPEGGGSLPIDVDIVYECIIGGKEYHEHQELWLDVLLVGHTSLSPPQTAAQKSEIKSKIQPLVKEVVRCLNCSTPIRNTEPIFTCTCGEIYHLDCIAALDICLRCGTDLKQKVRHS